MNYSSVRYCKLTGWWGTASSDNSTELAALKWEPDERAKQVSPAWVLWEHLLLSCVVSKNLSHSLQMDLTIPIVQFFFKTKKPVLNVLVCECYRLEHKPLPKDSKLFLTSLSEASLQSWSLVLLQYCWVIVLLIVQTNGLAGNLLVLLTAVCFVCRISLEGCFEQWNSH